MAEPYLVGLDDPTERGLRHAIDLLSVLPHENGCISLEPEDEYDARSCDCRVGAAVEAVREVLR